MNRRNCMELIEMQVSGIYIDPNSNIPIVILKDKKTKNILPIWIGPLEASSILLELEHVTPPRPMTHDLFVNFVKQNNIRIKKIIITELNNNTYFAKILYKSGLKTREMDARPSDAISIALRTKAALFVNKDVIDNTFNLHSSLKSRNLNDYYKQILEKLDKKDLGDTVM